MVRLLWGFVRQFWYRMLSQFSKSKVVVVWYGMTWYDVYLLQMGFHPVAVVGKLVQKYERNSCIQKEKQYTKKYKNTEYTK